MKRFSAPTLEEAYRQAAQAFGCSIADLDIEVIQHPGSGLFGLFKKHAIIVADYKRGRITAVTMPEQTTELNRGSEPEIKHQSKTRQEQRKDIGERIFEEERGTDEIGEETIAREIENKLKELMSLSCFDIDIVEVDVRDGIAYIFIDGNDAALLIGKEGYRYNALSYMLYSWLNSVYDLHIKLEIAQFLTIQQEMIANYLVEVIEEIKQYGQGAH